jgi:hypothetical protein
MQQQMQMDDPGDELKKSQTNQGQRGPRGRGMGMNWIPSKKQEREAIGTHPFDTVVYRGSSFSCKKKNKLFK